jgi:hypothetical protein
MMSNVARRENIYHQPEIRIFLVNSIVGKGKWGLIYILLYIFMNI